jgi:hypothetical protein
MTANLYLKSHSVGSGREISKDVLAAIAKFNCFIITRKSIKEEDITVWYRMEL